MTITVAILVTDAAKDAVVAAVNALTPEYTIGFARKVCPIDPAPTWETPATHWYTNGESVPESVVATWQTALPEMEGVVYWLAYNSSNSLEWAYTNMASEGLMFVPDPPL
jgi:hypothetical protein